MFGSDINHDQHTQDNVEQSSTHSTNNITCDFIANDTFQPTICTNYCLCTCCHNTDIPRSQCIIFKESKYIFDNTIVVEALSTDSQLLHLQNTYARNVIKTEYKKSCK